MFENELKDAEAANILIVMRNNGKAISLVKSEPISPCKLYNDNVVPIFHPGFYEFFLLKNI
ncbi:unnamed protein product [Meloidogyne enterolobii]|uniref:Uncharacterized protein n=1 Tax=Meloidogyne enterolobii TaxID=390850 RepID=A0ACB1B5M5_MELEN